MVYKWRHHWKHSFRLELSNVKVLGFIRCFLSNSGLKWISKYTWVLKMLFIYFCNHVLNEKCSFARKIGVFSFRLLTKVVQRLQLETSILSIQTMYFSVQQRSVSVCDVCKISDWHLEQFHFQKTQFACKKQKADFSKFKNYLIFFNSTLQTTNFPKTMPIAWFYQWM